MNRVTFDRVKVSVVRQQCQRYRAPRVVRSAGDVADLCRAVIGDDPREHMLAVYLDARHQVLAVHVVSIGTVTAAAAHPREFFAPALDLMATAAIACHNHPAGDPKPSPDDDATSERFRVAGEILGIPLLDHVILGADRYYSSAQEESFPYDTE